MDDQKLERLAKETYRAYGEITAFKNYQGLPMPEWDKLTTTIQQAWKAAALFAYRQGVIETGLSETPDHR